ncbi:MAG: hypothetical protein QMC89_03830 [Candidatus Hodarchaeaceae archaeon]|nr:hypothetical protein [Candidatus Hodarchaeaceae archaeon]
MKRQEEAEERARREGMQRIRENQALINEIAGKYAPRRVLEAFAFENKEYAKLHAEAVVRWSNQIFKGAKGKSDRRELWDIFLRNFRERGKEFLRLIIYGPKRPTNYPIYPHYLIYPTYSYYR